MYYFCREDLFTSQGIIEVAGHTEITGALLWTAGHKFANPVPEQILYLDTAYGANFPAFFDTTIPLMHDDLIKAFHESGVYSFDAYPMILKNPQTGEECFNYKAVNFIGRLDALDGDNSFFDEEIDCYTKLVIDSSKTQGVNCFRLKEGPDLLVVDEDVASILKKYNFKALLIQSLKDFEGD